MVKWKGVAKMKWKGSAYPRYRKSRDPTSGVEYVNRYAKLPYSHVYGADYGIKTKKVGEKVFRKVKRR